RDVGPGGLRGNRGLGARDRGATRDRGAAPGRQDRRGARRRAARGVGVVSARSIDDPPADAGVDDPRLDADVARVVRRLRAADGALDRHLEADVYLALGYEVAQHARGLRLRG